MDMSTKRLKSKPLNRLLRWVGAATLAGVAATSSFAQGWQPTKSVEFIVPAGTGGGADQMARFVQGLITKHKLMSQPLVVLNKSGGAGATATRCVCGAKTTCVRLRPLPGLF